MTPALDRLLADMRVWVRATDVPPPRSEAGRLREAIASLEAENDPRAGWNAVMRDNLLLRLRELVDIRQDMRDLRSHIEAGGGAKDGTQRNMLALQDVELGIPDTENEPDSAKSCFWSKD